MTTVDQDDIRDSVLAASLSALVRKLANANFDRLRYELREVFVRTEFRAYLPPAAGSHIHSVYGAAAAATAAVAFTIPVPH
jgi:hypothetical protein